MTNIQRYTAQIVREAQSTPLPCGGYQYSDKPQTTLSIGELEAQFYARIIKEYGSIDAYNQRKRG